MPPTRRSFPALATWLLILAAMIFVMIVLGGATRLTGSGLSIMEWAPIMGTLPPMNEAEWERLFALYKQIPQYELVNAGFGIDGFKRIFWLEWVHRFWGRAMGVVLLLPLIGFWWAGKIDRPLRNRLILLFVLGGMQGGVGWFMVASGFFPDSTAVSQYRLVAHLVLALLLYAAVLWTGLSQLRPERGGAPLGFRLLTWVSVLSVALTIVAGGFVAGLHAGLTFNTFPLMDGRWIPEGYAELQPFVRNLTENVAAVQFDHRLLATTTAIVVTLTVWVGWRAAPTHRRRLLALAATVATQYLLGIETLLSVVPVSLGILHQATAVLVLTAALMLAHALRRPN